MDDIIGYLMVSGLVCFGLAILINGVEGLDQKNVSRATVILGWGVCLTMGTGAILCLVQLFF
jgi:hypothetical protein